MAHGTTVSPRSWPRAAGPATIAAAALIAAWRGGCLGPSSPAHGWAGRGDGGAPRYRPLLRAGRHQRRGLFLHDPAWPTCAGAARGSGRCCHAGRLPALAAAGDADPAAVQTSLGLVDHRPDGLHVMQCGLRAVSAGADAYRAQFRLQGACLSPAPARRSATSPLPHRRSAGPGPVRAQHAQRACWPSAWPRDSTG